MKIEQLRYLVEIARTNSINQAAENLFLSQPNLSMSIRALEEELGCVLVKRTNRGAQLTEKGNDFLGYATSILEQFDRLRLIGYPENGSALPCLSISNTGIDDVTSAAAKFINRHRNHPVRLIMRNASTRDDTIHVVENSRCEIGFLTILSCYKRDITRQIESKDLTYHYLFSETFNIWVRNDHPLVKHDGRPVTREQLRQYPYLSGENMDKYHYDDAAELLQIATDSSRIISDGSKAMQELLLNTDAFWLGVGNLNGNDKHITQGSLFQCLELEDCDLTAEIGWIFPKNQVLPPLAKEFLDIMTAGLYAEG